MPISPLIFISWLLGPLLQPILLVLILKRRLAATFPLFFSYIAFQIAKSAVLFPVYKFRYDEYSSAYWIANGFSVLLALAVMDETWRRLFHPFGAVRTLGSTVFRWAAVVLILIALIVAFSAPEGYSGRMGEAILNLDRSVRLMQCGLALLLILFSRQLRLAWRHPAVGIAMGFGIFAAVEFLLVTSFMGSFAGIRTISVVKSFSFTAVTLLWIYVFSRPNCAAEPAVPVRLAEEQGIAGVNRAAGSGAVIALVEDTVERILNRNYWPKAAVRRSQIVGRKPSSEEKN